MAKKDPTKDVKLRLKNVPLLQMQYNHRLNDNISIVENLNIL